MTYRARARRIKPTRLLALTAAILATAATSAEASMVPDYSYRWPGQKITFYIAGPASGGVVAAANAWNRARVGMRFERVQKRSRAQVTFTFTKDPTCNMLSVPIGYHFDWNPRAFRFEPGTTRAELTTGCLGQPYWLRLLAARSFGFVLGLGAFNGGCAVMNSNFELPDTSSVRPSKCPPAGTRYYENPVQADDVRGARALYAKPFVNPPTEFSRAGEDPNAKLRDE